MRCVTQTTVLADWRVLPQERATFFGVTVDASIVKRLPRHYVGCIVGMRAVAAGASHLVVE